MTIGVDMVEISSRTNATKKRIVNGVAGRSIVKGAFWTTAAIELKGEATLSRCSGFSAPRWDLSVGGGLGCPCERLASALAFAH